MQYNLFAYCNDNPVGNRDSIGKFDVIVALALISAILFTAVVAYETIIYYNSTNYSERLITMANEWVKSQGQNNNDRNQSVYVLRDAEKNVVYVGRTNNLTIRRNQHKLDPSKSSLEMKEVESGLTREEARGYEQILMMHYITKEQGNYMKNQINGIAHGNIRAMGYFFSAVVNGASKYLSNSISDQILNWREGNW